MLRDRAGFTCVVALCLSAASLLPAQDSSAVSPPRKAPRGAQFWIPLGSVFIPGLGQYIHGEPLTGAAYTATAVAGFVVGGTGSADPLATGDFPRDGRNQLASEAFRVQATAGYLSAWDAFHRAVPALQREGKYEFLTTQERLRDLLTAPFETEFLGRWTTWVDLAYTGLVTGLLLADRDAGVAYEPFRARDAAFVTSLSLNAGIGEEAMFRGWLLPHFHQNLGERFWLANTLQASVFGALHVAQADEFAAVITAWALYEGWLTRRNDWSVRESIFHHFWYDLAVGTATFLADEREPRFQVTFPTIRF